jgi:hypothetical protein
VFDQQQESDTYVLRAGWARQLGAHTDLLFRAGPRMTDGTPGAELFASVSHRWRFASAVLSGAQRRTTVLGYAGTVETRSLQAKLMYSRGRSLTAHVTPAVIRSVHHELEGTVYRIGLGARYALTPLLGLEATWNRDLQNGGIDPLLANTELSHNTLSIGVTTRWNSADTSGTGRYQ